MFKSHSYPLDSPIQGYPCPLCKLCNDANTWLRQRHFLIGEDLKRRLNDKNKSGLRGQVDLTDVAIRSV